MTCMEMRGNGARTGMMKIITPIVQQIIRKDQRRGLSIYYAAATGYIRQNTVAHPEDAGLILRDASPMEAVFGSAVPTASRSPRWQKGRKRLTPVLFNQSVWASMSISGHVLSRERRGTYSTRGWLAIQTFRIKSAEHKKTGRSFPRPVSVALLSFRESI